jgi:hypothetical protein
MDHESSTGSGSRESAAASPYPSTDDGGSSSMNSASGLSAVQVQAAVAVSIPPAILSLIGSCMILNLVVQSMGGGYSRKQPRSRLDTYKRILFGMSVFDVTISFNYALQYFLLPRDTSSQQDDDDDMGFKTLGNQTTCTVSAVLLQLGTGAFIYYGMLSCYYLLIIRYGISPSKMARRFEPWMHFLAICFPIGTSIAGLILHVFGAAPHSSGCWVTMPPDCPAAAANEQLSLRCNPNIIAAIFALLPCVAMIPVILVNNAMIFYAVHSTLKRTRNRTFASASIAAIVASSSPSTEAVVSSSTILQPEQQQIPSSDLTNSTGSSLFLSSSSTQHHYPKRTSCRTGVAAITVNSRQRQHASNKAQAVATQCSLYVAVFFLTYSWSIVIAIFGTVTGGQATPYALVLLERIFLPMSGFWNLFIYIRPRYMTCRQQFPNETKWWAWRRAYFGDDSSHPQPNTVAVVTPSAGASASTVLSATMTTTACTTTTTQQQPANQKSVGTT